MAARYNICRVTLYNGRRGAEFARMTFEQWLEAESGYWLNEEHLRKMDLWDYVKSKDFLIARVVSFKDLVEKNKN